MQVDPQLLFLYYAEIKKYCKESLKIEMKREKVRECHHRKQNNKNNPTSKLGKFPPYPRKKSSPSIKVSKKGKACRNTKDNPPPSRGCIHNPKEQKNQTKVIHIWKYIKKEKEK